MMKIYYSEEYEGHLYVKPSEAGALQVQKGCLAQMDTIVANTMGLLQQLALRLGLHFDAVPSHERIALFYEAMNKFFKKNPDNVLADSFRLSGLSTAKTVLGWRDELRNAGCLKDEAQLSEMIASVKSERLKAVFEIERFFSDYDTLSEKKKSLASQDRMTIWQQVLAELERQSLDCCDYQIILPCSIDLLRPSEQVLLKRLQQHGASLSVLPYAADKKVNEKSEKKNNLSLIRQIIEEESKEKIHFRKDDGSFLIYEFEDDNDAYQYLSYKKFDDVDVWVNADNKQMDNWLKLMRKPQTGSVMQGCTPQLTELFVIGVSLFMLPLNVNSLIEWLNMPLHPLDSFFRKRLADVIVKEGGYRNETCRNLIDDYVAGKFVYLTDEQKQLPEEEKEKLRKVDAKKRRKLADLFLPSFKNISTERLVLFSQALGSWAMQRAALLEQAGNQQLYVEQLNAVKSMTDAFLILLGTVDSDSVEQKTVDSWLSSIYGKSSFTHANAEKGSRIVVDSPAKIVTISDKTVWMGMNAEVSVCQECSFLYPSEREELVAHGWIVPWDESKENKYHELMGMMPLFHTQKNLILVYCKHRAGELSQKHPLLVRLEQQVADAEELEKIVVRPEFCSDEMEEVEGFVNVTQEGEVHFDHADLLRWPDHLSPTSIGTLVEYPFDYLMETLLNITADGKAQMDDVKTIKGTVAHAVIECLFAPRDGCRTSSASDIKLRIQEEYEMVYQKMLESKGAILLLPENKLEGKLLHEQLKGCLDILADILKNNRLRVLACEKRVQFEDILGFMDMVLEDKDGHPVVFDFKWTGSRRYHRGLLEANRSIQLEFYRYLLTHEGKDEVKKVAYFLMPEAQLYSQQPFDGNHCTQVEPANQDDIVQQLLRSVEYRKKQLSHGIVEVNDFFENISYVKDTEKKHLFPLLMDEESGMKKDNIFSNYTLFE